MTSGDALHSVAAEEEANAPVPLGDLHRAMLNLLEDADSENHRQEANQKATLNILSDFVEEKERLAAVQRAMLNILEDADSERQGLEAAQRAMLNMLEDLDGEKTKVERTNEGLAREVAAHELSECALRAAKSAAEGANRELEAFAYSVAHDLRAPLRSIDGFSLALLEDCADQLDATGKGYLRDVRDSAQQMAHLIEDLLSLSRVTRSDLERVPVDLATLARAILTRLKSAHPERNVQAVVPAQVMATADARMLAIALENLIGNAWKFSARKPSARIEFGTQFLDGRVVYFVRDDGAGFDMAYADKLFGVFQRLHSPTEFEGTGIGLATVQRIVQRHGGTIWAEGRVGVGAAFYFTLAEVP